MFHVPRHSGGHPRLAAGFLALLFILAAGLIAWATVRPVTAASPPEPAAPRPPLVVVQDLPQLTEQLERWGQRLNIPVVKGQPNADPSSVCFNAHQKAIADGSKYLICDTAGRLHTRHNLMEELSKIKRTLAKNDETAPHLTLLVVDATTGANALQQAKEFHKACPLDGVIVTKMDGSGKGGVAVAIHDQLGIAPRFLGTGEEPDAFSLFNKQKFVEEML